MARRKKEAKPENHERWLITYADMITLLMVFFIVLYAGSLSDSKKFGALASSLTQAFNVDLMQGGPATTGDTGGGDLASIIQGMRRDAELLQKQFEALQAPGIGRGGVEVTVTQEGMLISMYGNVLFDSGKANLSDDAIPVLDQVIALVQRSNYNVRVEGHTDNVPIETLLYPTNWELSTARATAVVRHLAEQGVAANRLQAVGYADTRPLVANDTREHRARNRRVDIQILLPGLGAPPVPAKGAPIATEAPTSSRGGH